jgi:hypothetical protein
MDETKITLFFSVHQLLAAARRGCLQPLPGRRGREQTGLRLNTNGQKGRAFTYPHPPGPSGRTR